MKQRLSTRLKEHLNEAHRPHRPHMVGHRTLGNLKRRTGAMKSVANQDMKQGRRYDAHTRKLAEEAIKKVKKEVETEKQRQTGKTDTGSKPEKVETELVHHPLVGPI